jgi:BioD-like phosphotransacetylase family protein
MKKIFVAATRQNDGKTMVSLGLFNAFQKRFKEIAYMKPVGQQYRIIDGKKIDKDAVLFRNVYGLQDEPIDMSPIAVSKGFTESYINSPDRNALVTEIESAFDRLSENKEFVLFEGTGHAGVGSVFEMSNAHVAQLLGSKVILVSLGGIGKAIDELILNKACFDLLGVEILGVIINKVQPEKYDKINTVVRQGLARHGIEVLGVIPFVSALIRPTVAELYEELGAELLSGREHLSRPVGNFVIGDMRPHDAMDYFKGDTLLICPGNREELVMTALCGNLLDTDITYSVSAIIFTAGLRPHEKMMNLIRSSNIPMMQVEEDSFSVATKINKMLFKIHAEESQKIEKIQSLIEDYVDIDRICEKLGN